MSNKLKQQAPSNFPLQCITDFYSVCVNVFDTNFCVADYSAKAIELLLVEHKSVVSCRKRKGIPNDLLKKVLYCLDTKTLLFTSFHFRDTASLNENFVSFTSLIVLLSVKRHKTAYLNIITLLLLLLLSLLASS